MKKYNKATAAILAGAIVAVVGGFFALDAELLAAIQTVLTAVLVYAVPNQES